MECPHCMIESNAHGEHMPLELYKKALDFSVKFDPYLIFLSGGEPTDHPDFIEYVNLAKQYVKDKKAATILIASNGMFLDKESYAEKILDLGIPIQVTHDDQFYPKKIKVIEHPLLMYEGKLTLLTPLGRAASNNLLSNRQSPLCFNLRSAVAYFKNFKEAVGYIRSKMKMCIPSINVDGTISTGESSCCYHIGTVDSTDEELVNNINAMRCGKCGLYKNLQGEAKKLWESFEHED